MFEPINLVDINSHWAQQCITQLVSRQIVKGYPDKTFRPEGTITRAEFAVILQKAFTDKQTTVNVPPLNQDVYFSDVPKSHWAYNAIQIAAYRNFVVGYPNGTFQPNQNISRVQAIAVVRNIFNFPGQKNTEQVLKQYFDDWQTIPAYAQGAIATASENFLVVNYPQVRRLQPNRNTTRGDATALMCQALSIWNQVPAQYVVGSQAFAIQPQFDEVQAFSEGVAWVRVDRKWGLIDKKGNFLIKPEYYTQYPFSSGLGLVTIGGKFRYIDKTGKIIIAQNFEQANSFSEGLAAVSIDGKYGYINPQGKFVISPQFDAANYFSEGLASVRIADKWGFIDQSGKLIIQPQFKWVEPFSDKAAFVSDGISKFGFVDQTGSFTEVEELQSVDVNSSFHEGLARFQLVAGDGFIDKTGKLVLPLTYRASNFYEGLAAVYSNNKSGFIDRTGKVVIPLIFDGASIFSEGLASIKLDNKFGYINKSGNIVISPHFSQAGEFKEGMAPAAIGSGYYQGSYMRKWGYIAKPK
jgi:hypothetical protein